MARIERFEDIIAWQKARALTREIYQITTNTNFAKDFVLKDQLRRASISVMLNIAEGFARRTDREFVRFLFIAHGSIAEIQSALYVAIDQNYLHKESFDHLYHDCTEISRLVSGLIKYLKNNG